MQLHDCENLVKELVQGGYAMAKRHSLEREEEQYTIGLVKLPRVVVRATGIRYYVSAPFNNLEPLLAEPARIKSGILK